MDMNTAHAKSGFKAQQYILDELRSKPGTITVDGVSVSSDGYRIHDSRYFAQCYMGVFHEQSLNYFEKVNGDIWGVSKQGKLHQIEVCSGVPGNYKLSVGESKAKLYAGNWYCFVTLGEERFGDDLYVKHVCFAKRISVLSYLDAQPEYHISKTGGEDYKLFLPETFQNGIHSIDEFIEKVLKD